MRIADIPLENRPRERFLRQGASVLSSPLNNVETTHQKQERI